MKYTSDIINQQLKNTNKPMACIGVGVPNTKTKTNFKCTTCRYVWDATLEKIFLGNTGCPNCAGRPKLTNERADKLLKEKQRNARRLEQISGTCNKIKWQCINNKNHNWKATPKDVIHKGTGCPHCRKGIFGAEQTLASGIPFRSKREAESYNILLEFFEPEDILLQQRYNTNTKHTCDFVISSQNWWIEIGNIKSKKYLHTLMLKRNWIEQKGDKWFQFDSSVELHQFLCDNL